MAASSRATRFRFATAILAANRQSLPSYYRGICNLISGTLLERSRNYAVPLLADVRFSNFAPLKGGWCVMARVDGIGRNYVRERFRVRVFAIDLAVDPDC